MEFKIFSCIGMLVGLLMIVGTKLEWDFLIDPPEEWAPFYSHSGLKKLFGSDFLIPFNYIVGTLICLLSMKALWDAFIG